MRYFNDKIIAIIGVLLIGSHLFFMSSCTTETTRRHPKTLDMNYFCEAYSCWVEHYFTISKDSFVCSTNNPDIPIKVYTAEELNIDLERLIQVFYYTNENNLTLDYSWADSEKGMYAHHDVVWEVNGCYTLHMQPDEMLYDSDAKLNNDFWRLDSLVFNLGLEYDKYIRSYKPNYRLNDEINRFNSKGKKTGKWLSYKKNKVIVSRYKEGLLDGLFEVYNDLGLLTYTMVYEAGKMIGPSYSFHDDNISYAHLDIKSNSDSIYSHRYQTKVAPDMQAFEYNFFFGAGRLVSSGIVTFNKDDRFYTLKFTTPVDIKEYNEPSDYQFIKQLSPLNIQ